MNEAKAVPFRPSEHFNRALLAQVMTDCALAGGEMPASIGDLLPRLVPNNLAAIAVGFTVAHASADVLLSTNPAPGPGALWSIRVVPLADANDPDSARHIRAAELASQAISAILNGDRQDALTILSTVMDSFETGAPMLLTQLRIWGWVCEGHDVAAILEHAVS